MKKHCIICPHYFQQCLVFDEKNLLGERGCYKCIFEKISKNWFDSKYFKNNMCHWVYISINIDYNIHKKKRTTVGVFHHYFFFYSDWESSTDQVYCCPRGWRLSATTCAQFRTTPETPRTSQSTIVLRGLRGSLIGPPWGLEGYQFGHDVRFLITPTIYLLYFIIYILYLVPEFFAVGLFSVGQFAVKKKT